MLFDLQRYLTDFDEAFLIDRVVQEDGNNKYDMHNIEEKHPCEPGRVASIKNMFGSYQIVM
jgi:hypothetical protein